MFYLEKLRNGNIVLKDDSQNNKVIREFIPPCTVNTGDRDRIFITRNNKDQCTINLRTLSKLVTESETTYIGNATTLESVAEILRNNFFRLNTLDQSRLGAILSTPNLIQQAALGALEGQGVEYALIYGRNGSITTASDPEDIIPSEIYSFLETAEYFTFVSDNANDSSGGTGMQQVEIKALDENFKPFTILLDTNGTTPVVYDTKLIRAINQTKGVVFGSGKTNAGICTITGNSSSKRITALVNERGLAAQLIYTVKAGYIALVMGFQLNSENTATASQIQYRMLIGSNNDLITRYSSAIGSAGVDAASFTGGMFVDEKENITFRVDTVTNTQSIVGMAEILLIKKTLLA